MSAGEQEPEAGVEEEESAGEPRQMSDRTAKAILLAVGALAAWGILVAAPWIAYVVVGILLDRGWQKIRAWRAVRQDDAAPEVPEVGPLLDVVAELQALGRHGNSVLLTELRDALGVADTKVVKQLLDEEGIPWKPVRTPNGNGPGVHKDAVPAVFSPAADSHGEGCCCRSGGNGNGDNGGGEGAGEGFRVVRIGTDGKIVYDPKETVRHHKV